MQRRRSNIIARLRDEHGMVHSDEQQKGEVFVSYFLNIFSSNGRDSLEFVRNLNIPTLISSDMNVVLTAQITRAEIKQAFFNIGKYQAPGSDGFTGSFFQRFWDQIGADVSEAILSFFSTGRLLHSINHTWLVLIPKVANADSMQQLRPIGLCQVMYKAISKILSNRLSTILPHIISPFQNGFIKGRCISDNILIGQEVMQFLKTKVFGQDKWMALKLDMEKAYDRVEWGFLFHIMESMGFCTQWMKWVKACVTTVRFSMLLNGNEYGYFQPQRGIRQGDPLSPLLFAIYTEAFAAMISQAVATSTLHDLKVHRSAPPLSHLFYADDSYLFLRASVPECANLLHLLAEYERYSGQRVNLHKSAMCGSANVSEQELLSLSSFLGVATMSPDDKYLGLLSQLRRSKSLNFQFIEEDLAARIRSGKTKALSLAAKEVVIKSIGAAGPIYAMSAFRLPQETCRRCNSLLSKFWWANQDKERGIHWISWSAICQSKFVGGLGFRDFNLFNVALLAKQAWRILDNPTSTLARIYQARYHPHRSFLEATAGPHPSWAWQGILTGRDLLRRGLRWQVGSGNQIHTLTDNWLPSSPPSPPVLKPGLNDCPPLVSDLICHTSHSWRKDLLLSLFTLESVDLILSIPLPTSVSTDRLIWHYSSSGLYTVKTGYHLLASEYDLHHPPTVLPFDTRFWKFLWSIPVPPKLKFFFWRAVRGFLPLQIVLFTKTLVSDTICPICSREPESFSHFFFSCRVAQGPWRLADLEGVRITLGGMSPDEAWCHLFFSMNLSKIEIANIVFILWRLWKGRCWSVHEGIQYLPSALFRQFQRQVGEWRTLGPNSSIQPLGGTVSAAPGPSRTPGNAPTTPSSPSLINVWFDGATKGGHGGSIGFVGYHTAGNVLFAFGKFYEGIQDPFLMECLALRDAIHWCLTHSFLSVCFHGDSQLLIRRMIGGDMHHVRGGAILEDVRSLASSFLDVSFVFVSRQLNRAAHHVAQQALPLGVRLFVDSRALLSSGL
ncbi:unnamed protein product [Linum trigynum]|uniref:Reverse transcriptase domain-containing protein n=1 Tax=Linum trigynum TaxID=586398 RepID=A0AAV2CZZ3_9ROSI